MNLTMKKRILFSFFLISGFAFSQQESQFASGFNNPYLYNPAAGGLSNVTQIDAVARMQWVGAGDGPTTMNLSGHSVIGIGNSAKVEDYNPKGKAFYARPEVNVGSLKHVVGGRIVSDKIGVFNKVGVYGSYAIHIPVTKEFNVGAGIGLGWGNYRINPSRVVLFDQNDDTYATALGNSSQQNIFDANAGLVFYGKGLFFGASVTQALKNKAKFDGVMTSSNYNRHYNLTLSYGLKMGKSVLEPGVIAKFAENSPVNLDFGARFIVNNVAWIGVYGRTSNNLVLQLGTTLVGNVYLCYSYEHSIGKIRNAASGTHEIQLGIYLGKKKVKKKKEDSTEGSSEESTTE